MAENWIPRASGKHKDIACTYIYTIPIFHVSRTPRTATLLHVILEYRVPFPAPIWTLSLAAECTVMRPS